MKKIVSIVLSFALVISSISFTAKVTQADDYKCGKNIAWNWDGRTHTLTLSGEGAMYDYSASGDNVAPWASNKIETLILGDGITEIGKNAFYGQESIVAVNLPKTTEGIREGAFYGLKKITGLYVPYGVKYIDALAFAETGTDGVGLTVSLPGSLEKIDDTMIKGAKLSSIAYCGCTLPDGTIKPDKLIDDVYIAMSQTTTAGIQLDIRHHYGYNVIPATFGKEGMKSEGICERCHIIQEGATVEKIPMLMEPIVSPMNVVYDGQIHKPTVAVFNSDNELVNPTIINYHNAEFVNAGTYTISINYAGNSLYHGLKDIKYTILPAPKTIEIKLDKTAFTYNGKVQKPTASVICDGDDMAQEEYNLVIPESKNPGKYTVVASLKGNYAGSAKATYVIEKKSQSPKIKIKTKTVKAKRLKKKKATVKKAMTVTAGTGKITYKKVKSGSSNKLSINSKNGVITIKKGTKKGTYKIKVKISVAGDNITSGYTKTVNVKVKVK